MPKRVLSFHSSLKAWCSPQMTHFILTLSSQYVSCHFLNLLIAILSGLRKWRHLLKILTCIRPTKFVYQTIPYTEGASYKVTGVQMRGINTFPDHQTNGDYKVEYNMTPHLIERFWVEGAHYHPIKEATIGCKGIGNCRNNLRNIKNNATQHTVPTQLHAPTPVKQPTLLHMCVPSTCTWESVQQFLGLWCTISHSWMWVRG